MSRFSITGSSRSRASSCGTTPMRARMRRPSVAGSRPSTRSVPPVTGETQAIMRMVEDLPAPFGPEDAERLAPVQVEVDAVDRGEGGAAAFLGREPFHEVLGVDQYFGGHSRTYADRTTSCN